MGSLAGPLAGLRSLFVKFTSGVECQKVKFVFHSTNIAAWAPPKNERGCSDWQGGSDTVEKLRLLTARRESSTPPLLCVEFICNINLEKFETFFCQSPLSRGKEPIKSWEFPGIPGISGFSLDAQLLASFHLARHLHCGVTQIYSSVQWSLVVHTY